MSAYKICREGQELGSFDAAQIQEGLQTGYFLPTDWGWSEGMTDWKALPELTSASTQPLAAVSSAPKARPIASPQSVGVKPSGSITTGLNPYTAPVSKPNSGNTAGVSVPLQIITELSGTKPWVRLVSVMMWIVSIIFFLLMLVGMFTSAVSTGRSNVWIGIVVAFLYFYPAQKLSNYASNISRLSESKSYADLLASLREQRRFWKFLGILTLIYLSLFLLIFGGVTFLELSRRG